MAKDLDSDPWRSRERWRRAPSRSDAHQQGRPVLGSHSPVVSPVVGGGLTSPGVPFLPERTSVLVGPSATPRKCGVSGGPPGPGVPSPCRMADHAPPPPDDRAPALVRALDVATSGVLVCDARTPSPAITYVNGAFERLFGRTAQELVGYDVAQLVGEAIEDAGARHALAAALHRQTPHEATFVLRRRDGTSFRAELRITPVRDGDGAATDWIAVVDDVTARLDALDQLALAEARYRTLVEHVPAVAYVADWDAHATLTYISPQIEGLLGWPPQAFIDDQDLWYRCIHPADVDRVKQAERDSYAAGTRVDIEFRMTARDGRELWVRDKETVVRDADGAPRFSQGVLVDVTPTRATESELADERHRAQRYLDIAGAIIVILDAEARITLLNRAGAELLGYDEGELIGRDWYDAVVPQRLQEQGRAAYAEELQAEADDAVHESVVVTKSGEERTIAWRDTVVRDADGTRQRHDVERGGPDRAPRGRGADRLPRLPRLAHRPAQPRAAAGAPRPRARQGAARRPRGRPALPRPRRLQARQRLARPPGRRRAALPRDDAPLRAPPRLRPPRPPGRRRVPAAAHRPGPPGRRAARARRRRRPARRAGRAVLDLRRRVPHRRVDRRLALPARRRRRRRAAAPRRRRDVRRQGRGAQHASRSTTATRTSRSNGSQHDRAACARRSTAAS